MKEAKSLLVLASTMLLASCAFTLEGQSSINKDVSSNAPTCSSFNTEFNTTSKDNAECLYIIQSISKELFGSAVEGVDYEYSEDYDSYSTSAVWECKPEKAIEEAKDYLPSCVTVDPENEGGYFDFFGFEFWAAYYFGPSGNTCVDLIAFADDGETFVEFDVYVAKEYEEDPDEPVVDDPTYGDPQCIAAIEEISSKIYDGDTEMYDYDEDYGIYYTYAEYTDKTPEQAIKDAELYLPAGAKIDPEYPAENEENVYGIYYLSANGEVSIDVYAYEGEDCTYLEYDVYLTSSIIQGGEDDEDDGLEQAEKLMQGICTNLFGSATYGEDYAYDEDYELFYTYAEVDGTPAENIKTAPNYLPAGCRIDPDYPGYEEDGEYGVYYLSANGEVSIDIYSYVEDGATYIEFDVYMTDSLYPGEDEGADIETGEDSSGTKYVSLGLENLTSETSVPFTSQKAGDATFTASVGTGTAEPKYYSNGSSLRLYGGNVFSVSVESGYYISKIEIKSSTDGTLDLTSLTPSAGTFDINGTVGTLSLDNKTTSTVDFTRSSGGGNVRIIGVTVWYSAK